MFNAIIWLSYTCGENYKGEITMYKIKKWAEVNHKTSEIEKERKLNTKGWNLLLILSLQA